MRHTWGYRYKPFQNLKKWRCFKKSIFLKLFIKIIIFYFFFKRPIFLVKFRSIHLSADFVALKSEHRTGKRRIKLVQGQKEESVLARSTGTLVLGPAQIVGPRADALSLKNLFLFSNKYIIIQWFWWFVLVCGEKRFC